MKEQKYNLGNKYSSLQVGEGLYCDMVCYNAVLASGWFWMFRKNLSFPSSGNIFRQINETKKTAMS
jgi:hypothetical protein